METSGEVADLMVKEGIQITESATKLAGLGAKNLAAIIVALMKDETKLQGKTKLKQLLKSEKPLCILQIKENDVAAFNKEAKKYGVLFTAVTDKTNNTGLCDVIAKQEDVTKLNYIMEKMGYAIPEVEKDVPEDKTTKKETSKKQEPRTREDRSERKSKTYGENANPNKKRKSVRKSIDDINAGRTAKSKTAPSRAKSRSTKERPR